MARPSKHADRGPGARRAAVVIVGGGGHGLVVASILQALPGVRVLGYTDPRPGGPLSGAEYLGPDEVLEPPHAKAGGAELALGIGHMGDPGPRRAVVRRLEDLGHVFRQVISPGSMIATSVLLDRGTVVMPGAVINAGAHIGAYGIVNSNAVVEHGCVVGNHVHIAPGAVVCGDTRIGDRSMIGAGALVTEGLVVGADCLIGAGAVVTRSVEQPGVYIGCPARKLR